MWIVLRIEDLIILTLRKFLTYHVTSNDYIVNNSLDIHQAILKCQLITEAIGVNWVYLH